MELFKLLGKIAVENSDANRAIDETSDKANQADKKMSSAFRRIGEAVTNGFKKKPIDETNKSLASITDTAEKQREDLNKLKSRYADLYATHGKNSAEAKKCAKEIQELSQQLKGNEDKIREADAASRDFDKSLDEMGESAEDAGAKTGNAFAGIGKAAVKAAAFVGSAIVAVSGAFGKVTASSIENYANYEQLVGGVETLFNQTELNLQDYAKSIGKTAVQALDEWSDATKAGRIVMENAQVAYRTAGMSMNDYMETVTGFSASLIQSLDGDTVKAAQMADMAIQDMSDNANKMGTDISSIQSAYQGFSKQNYTMLDNLKLGYGGTKQEMERLLKDAQKLSGVKYDISSYADIVDAIHVIQDNMGITGTTAREAASTISGSIGMMKAAWTNFLTGMADSEQDFDALTDNLVDSVLTVADNIVPRVLETAPRLIEGFTTLVTKLEPHLIEILNSTLPVLIESAVMILDGIASALPEIIPVILPALLEGVVTVLTSLATELPGIIIQILPALINGVQALSDGLYAALPDILGGLFGETGSEIGGFLNDLHQQVQGLLSSVLPPLVEMIKNLMPVFMQIAQRIFPVIIDLMEQIAPVIAEIMETVMPLITQLIEELMPPIMDIIDAVLPVLIDLMEELLPVISEIIEMLAPLISTIIELAAPILSLIAEAIGPLLESFGGLVSSILQALMPAIQTIVGVFSSVLQPVISAITPILSAVLSSLTPIIDAISLLAGFILSLLVPAFDTIVSLIGGAFTTAFDAIKPIIDSVMEVFQGLVDFITGVLTGDWEKAWDGIVNIFKGIINLIPSAIETAVNGAIGLLNGLIKGVNKISGAIGIPAIPLIPDLKLPRLEKGGILEEGEIGLLEGNGAEAVVPLDQNQKWIHSVAKDMQSQGIGGGSVDELVAKLEVLYEKYTERVVEAILSLVQSGIIKVDDPYRIFKLVKDEEYKARIAGWELVNE